jgi:cytochrome c
MRFTPLFIAALLCWSNLGAANAADAKKGKKVFTQCLACHSVTADGPRRAGPHLAGLIGRTVGGDAGYTRYSDALKTADFAWTEERLDTFLTNPNGLLPGLQATMRVRKIRDEEDRKNLIAFLKQATAQKN